MAEPEAIVAVDENPPLSATVVDPHGLTTPPCLIAADYCTTGRGDKIIF